MTRKYKFVLAMTFIILIFIGLFIFIDYRDKKFIRQSKITTGEIIGIKRRGKWDNDIYMTIEFLYKGKMVVGENRYMTNYMAEDMHKWRHRKVLIAYDSLDPTTVSMILDEDRFKTYHLEMPDSLKNSNQIH